MSTIVIIDKLSTSVYANSKYDTYNNTFEAVLNKASSLAKHVVVLDEPSYKRGTKSFYQHIKKQVPAQASLFYLYADEPLIDTELCYTMLENHLTYKAQYSFAEGYPRGLCPQIIDTAILDQLIELADEQPATDRHFFFETIKKDINSFDIETLISKTDVRLDRVYLNYENYYNASVCDNLIKAGLRDEASALDLIVNHKELLWATPCYYNIQVTGKVAQQPSYLPPFKEQDTVMSLEQFKILLQKASNFSKEATIGLSFRGDGALHPQFISLIDEVAAYPGFHLSIETAGLGWTEAMIERLQQFPAEKLSLIVTLDTLKGNLYRSLRGEGFEEALQFTEKVLDRMPESAYVQTVRIPELEDDLESFYHYFIEKTDHIIIQKYNNYCGRLKGASIADIAPLKRFVCWALKRELSIKADGTVCRCGQDIDGQYAFGNIFTHDMKTLWEEAQKMRQNQLNSHYDSICKTCDEYYLFNF